MNIPLAEWKAVVQPQGVADDAEGKAVALGLAVRHSSLPTGVKLPEPSERCTQQHPAGKDDVRFELQRWQSRAHAETGICDGVAQGRVTSPGLRIKDEHQFLRRSLASLLEFLPNHETAPRWQGLPDRQ